MMCLFFSSYVSARYVPKNRKDISITSKKKKKTKTGNQFAMINIDNIDISLMESGVKTLSFLFISVHI